MTPEIRQPHSASPIEVRTSLVLFGIAIAALLLIERGGNVGNWWALILVVPGLVLPAVAWYLVQVRGRSGRYLSIFVTIGIACLLFAVMFLANVNFWLAVPVMLALGGMHVLYSAILA